jgi:hypothetical protein
MVKITSDLRTMGDMKINTSISLLFCRFWKKVFVKIVYHGEKPVVHLYNKADDKDPFQELPLEPCYSVSEIGK